MSKQPYKSPAVKVLMMTDRLMDMIEQSTGGDYPVIDDGETTLDAKPLPQYSVWEE